MDTILKKGYNITGSVFNAEPVIVLFKGILFNIFGGIKRMSDKQKAKNDIDENDDDQDDEEDNDTEGLNNQTKQIIETGSITMAKGKHLIHCLTIIGQVEGHFILPPQNKTTKYEHVIPQIVAIEEDPEIEGLLIILNTVGGDVEAGLAIAELLAGMKKPTVSLVLGGGHSIGVPLAISARRSFIVSTATMTIHPVRMNGIVVGVPQTLSYFDKMQDRIIKFVSENSHISAKRFKQLMMNTGELIMDVGTVLDGAAAVKEGLIDSLGGLSDAIRYLYQLIETQKAEEDNENNVSNKDKDESVIKDRCDKTENAEEKTEKNVENIRCDNKKSRRLHHKNKALSKKKKSVNR